MRDKGGEGRGDCRHPSAREGAANDQVRHALLAIIIHEPRIEETEYNFK